MLQEKRDDLSSEKQKRLVQRLLNDLTRSRPDLYYQATTEVARHIREYIVDGTDIAAEERALLEQLSVRDIELMLSLH